MLVSWNNLFLQWCASPEVVLISWPNFLVYNRREPHFWGSCILSASLHRPRGPDKKSLALAVLCLAPALGEHIACMTYRSSPSLKREVRKFWSEHLQHLRAECCWISSDFHAPLLTEASSQDGFQQGCGEWTGSRGLGGLGFSSQLCASTGVTGQNRFGVKNGDSKAAREKCSNLYWWTLPEAETFSFRKQLLFRHLSSGLPLLGKVACIFMSYFFITWLPSKVHPWQEVRIYRVWHICSDLTTFPGKRLKVLSRDETFSIAVCLENKCATSGQMQDLLPACNTVALNPLPLLRKWSSVERIPLVYQGRS